METVVATVKDVGTAKEEEYGTPVMPAIVSQTGVPTRMLRATKRFLTYSPGAVGQPRSGSAWLRLDISIACAGDCDLIGTPPTLS